jgi:hypothetical protein
MGRLSDFRKSKMTNPHPAFNLWSSIAYILNLPEDKLTNCHFYIIHTVICSGGAKKLCEIYGPQARKLIELAVGPWAEIGMQKGWQGARALRGWQIALLDHEWWRNQTR